MIGLHEGSFSFGVKQGVADEFRYRVVDLTRLILREVVSQPSCLWEVLLDTSSQISHMFWGMLSF